MANSVKRYTVKDIYKIGKAQKRVKYSNYRKAYILFIEKVMEQVIKKGAAFKIPEGMGTLQIRKKICKTQAIDFKKSKELEMLVYHNNFHSGTYRAFYHWDKAAPHCNFLNKSLWKFVGTRHNKRFLAKCIKEDNSINLYFEI